MPPKQNKAKKNEAIVARISNSNSLVTSEKIIQLENQLVGLLSEFKEVIQQAKNEHIQQSELLQKEQQTWKELASKLDSSLLPNKIKLDVGGTYFTTSKATLLKHKNSFFAAMLGGRYEIQPDAADGSYFIDRNPAVFSIILDFMRGQNIYLQNLNSHQLEQLIDDAKFYQLENLLEIISKLNVNNINNDNDVPLNVTNTQNKTNNNNNNNNNNYNNNNAGHELKFMEGPNYTLSYDNKVATKTSGGLWEAVVKGQLQISKQNQNNNQKLYRWNIKLITIPNSYIMIGVAPISIDQSIAAQYTSCGYYFYCATSVLYSGPPFSYLNKSGIGQYGSKECIKQGQVVGVEVNMENATIEFFVDGVSLGIAYQNIPLDTPLCPCVMLSETNTCIEIQPFI